MLNGGGPECHFERAEVAGRDSLELGERAVNVVGKGHRVGRGAPKACEGVFCCCALIWGGSRLLFDYLRRFFRDKKITVHFKKTKPTKLLTILGHDKLSLHHGDDDEGCMRPENGITIRF